MRSLQISAGGMAAQQLNVEVITHNIASMGVPGYKAQRAEFADIAYQNARVAGSATTGSGNILPTGMQVGLGVKAVAISRIMLPGDLQPTGRPLDLAIDGNGYFKIDLSNGAVGYTKAGNFQRSNTGVIVTNEGHPLQPQITIPTEAIEIAVSPTGEVLAKLANNPIPQVLGQIDIINFANAPGLQAIGDNLFQETSASGTPVSGAPGSPGFGALKQGVLEGSNVDPVKEMTNLVAAQRMYELNAEGVRLSGDMEKTTSSLRT